MDSIFWFVYFTVSKRPQSKKQTLLGIWRFVHRIHPLLGIFSGGGTTKLRATLCQILQRILPPGTQVHTDDWAAY